MVDLLHKLMQRNDLFYANQIKIKLKLNAKQIHQINDMH